MPPFIAGINARFICIHHLNLKSDLRAPASSIIHYLLETLTMSVKVPTIPFNQLDEGKMMKSPGRDSRLASNRSLFLLTRFFIAATLYVGVVVISFHRRKGTHAI